MKYIVASGSPRRKELMHKITDDFEVIVPIVDERKIESQLEKQFEVDSPNHAPMQDIARIICMELAMAKAKEVQRMINEDPKYANVIAKDEDYIIIGCDTSVAIKDEILGKPKDREDAVRMLRAESENLQYVVSGVAFVSRDDQMMFCNTTTVEFNKLNDEQEAKIQKYCDTEEPYDKAGAYGIQLYGDGFVKEIVGSFDNVIGFPVEKIREKLVEFIG